MVANRSFHTVAVAALVLGGLALGDVCDGSAPAGSEAKSLRDNLLDLHNRARAEAKIPPLTVSKKLEAAALSHATEMARRRRMTHEGEDGSQPADRILAAGYRIRRCGENVAFGRFRLERLMKGWLDSPVHKANILGNFAEIGVGHAVAEDGTSYWCVTFGVPARRK